MTGSPPPVELLREVRALAEDLHPRLHPVSVRVRLSGSGPALASCEVWTGDGDALLAHRADLPAAVGATMLDLERALVIAGYVYDLTPDGRPKYRYDNRGGLYTLDVTRPW
ncbi:hypothetical protein L1785_03140 [Antribacter sp. KLBMP9083]|uniref:Uncharacterized protein n=1 Tax=Antribacter soli TaxID=2910976 RepID=A0AA41QAN9_9MICO|nr:hypothetical protein [Antribacter soli]MCF4119965.1 hypothetical protein [Antribacter soli]